ncbi:MAG: PAAR-like domain-containing protein [Nitrospira sp.]
MANQVYANGREVSCKAATGKAVAAFPDVCMTPPQTPATPPGVPIPYPNNGMASDCTDGSKNVKISGKEVLLKDKSYFKKSTGDEAGCAPMKGVVTHKNMGKVYFNAWSMDVKFEGENVVRHFDLTTHNHASAPGGTPPWSYMDAANMSASDKCKEESAKTEKCMEEAVKKNTHQDKRRAHAKPGATKKSAVESDENVDWDALLKSDGGKGDFYNKTGANETFCEKCSDLVGCNLVPFDFGCCDGKTPHHVVPSHCFLKPGGRSEGEGDTYDHVKDYKHKKAPCICLDGQTKSDSDGGKLKEHGRVHEILDDLEQDRMPKTPKMGKTKQLTKKGELQWNREPGTWSFSDANDAGSDAVAQVTKCDKECLKKQSEAAHKNMDKTIGPETPLRADPFGTAEKGFVPAGAVPAIAAPT